MRNVPGQWDYLIVTAANDAQAAAYERQIELRRRLGGLSEILNMLVVPDESGRRIGSGGSTVACLARVVQKERTREVYPTAGDDNASVTQSGARDDGAQAAITAREGKTLYPSRLAPELNEEEAILSRLRILIIHAGGDSRRLPAYSACGKIFVPLPGENQSALGSTLFDRLVEAFLDLPSALPGAGQVVVTSGDALSSFDSSDLDFTSRGMTVLGSYAKPEEAARHGVFCPAADGTVRMVLQKPDLAAQIAAGAVDRRGQAVLDVGIMSFDAQTAALLLHVFCIQQESEEPGTNKEFRLKPYILDHGVDLYREVCCALGSEVSLAQYLSSVRQSGGRLEDSLLGELFSSLRSIPLHLEMLQHFSFLHLGSTRQLISNGLGLITRDMGSVPESTIISINNEVTDPGSIEGADSWVEGCRIHAPLKLSRGTVLVGVDVHAPLTVPEGACLDVIEGADRKGSRVWFVRCYGIDDSFKHPISQGATFCGRPLADWMQAVGVTPSEAWPSELPADERTLWNARVFLAEKSLEAFRQWLWIFNVDHATEEEKQRFLFADRYSASEIAVLADQAAFYSRRLSIRAAEIEESIARVFQRESRFSSHDLSFLIQHSHSPTKLVAKVLALAHESAMLSAGASLETLEFPRIAHSLGSAIDELAASDLVLLERVLLGLAKSLAPETVEWMQSIGLSLMTTGGARDWARTLCGVAFRRLNESIIENSQSSRARPQNSLRRDETIWGRAPARIDLGGGWSDTPPYTLENGGDVINTAINLNGQPPIHCYCRLLREPVIRLNSIDGGLHIELHELAELLDYRRPGDPFSLTKAALVISGFSPERDYWPRAVSLSEMLQIFGGGIEITTLVSIPQGSGLGTSSILGAVILGVINRLIGSSIGQQELFHEVLRLEQALTTGGGWQDQVGGCIGGTKITTTRPGMFPNPKFRYVPSDVIDPKINGGRTLLYYTGLTRLAKNLVEEIVGGYLNREHAIVAALREEHPAARAVADAMSHKDMARFGATISSAWALQERLSKAVTNPAIQSVLNRVQPFVYGVKIAGAGSGGFMLIVAKTPQDADRVRELLNREPLNDCSRFFDFEVNNVGLEIFNC